MKKFDSREDMKKGIWLWGTGDVAHYAMAACFSDAKDTNIKGVIDNNIQKQGDTFYNHKVLSFKEVCRNIKKDDLIVICCGAVFADEIEKQILNSGTGCNVCLFERTMNKMPYCYAVSKYLLGSLMESGYEERLISRCCTQKDFEREDFHWTANELKLNIIDKLHRKDWEFIYIVNVLKAHGILRNGRKGIGFAVGMEPLPSYFASKHIKILATDLDTQDEKAVDWIKSNQHSNGNWENLYRAQICSREEFEQFVSFRYVDMCNIPDGLSDFDFCWSSCAVEHVGSLQKALRCLKDMLKVLVRAAKSALLISPSERKRFCKLW